MNVALTTLEQQPSPTPEATVVKHGGFIPRALRLIEYNTQNAFTRYQDSSGRIFWAYLPRKASTLSARVYADTNNRSIEISVYEQDQRDPSNTTKGTRINNWTICLLISNDDWEKNLADYAGRAMKQAEKQPRCSCGGILHIRSLSHGCQVFVCSRSPHCSHIATIKDYGYSFD
jgi:hypothetical protein